MPAEKKCAQMQRFSQRSKKIATFLIVATVLISLTAAMASTPLRVAAATHPIEYQVSCSPSMVNDGTSLNYFKAHGFSVVYLVVPDKQTYKTELATIKSLGMKPIIDIEIPIWDGGKLAKTPIDSFATYFQSLKDAGWQYVASEGGRDGDLTYLAQFFKGYVNYNCDKCGLWGSAWTPPYKHPFTVSNSWESFYTTEWTYIKQGATEAAALGKQNGILAGVWGSAGGVDYNPILTNSKNGVYSDAAPSYTYMLDWSYSNGIGFNHFHVFFGLSQTLTQYKALGFEQVVTALQASYPAIGSAPQLSLSASNPSPAVGESYTLSGYLSDSNGKALANKPIDIWVRHDGDNGIRWKTITTDSNGYYGTSASSTQKAYIRTVFKGDSAYAGSSSDLVTVTPRVPTLTLTASTTTPLVGQSYTLSGVLRDGNGKALANKPIDIWVRHDNDNGIRWKTMTTDSNGYYGTSCLFHSKSLYTDCIYGRQRLRPRIQRPHDGDADHALITLLAGQRFFSKATQ